jgi:hypothetical protein
VQKNYRGVTEAGVPLLLVLGEVGIFVLGEVGIFLPSEVERALAVGRSMGHEQSAEARKRSRTKPYGTTTAQPNRHGILGSVCGVN